MGKAYQDSRGWKYRVMGGIAADSYKARYQRPEKRGDIGWKGLATVPWRKTREEAQADLDALAAQKGWREAIDYLRPIMESASLPGYQAALRLAVEALEDRIKLDEEEALACNGPRCSSCRYLARTGADTYYCILLSRLTVPALHCDDYVSWPYKELDIDETTN